MLRTARAWICCLVPCATLGLSSPAFAERSLDLAYEAPAGCGSEQEVRRKLAEALAQGAESDSGAASTEPVAASVVVSAEGAQGYQVSYEAETHGVTSRRRLVVDSCEAVTEAVSLLLLLTIEPGLAQTLAPTESPAPLDPAAPTEPENPAPSAPAAEATSSASAVPELEPSGDTAAAQDEPPASDPLDSPLQEYSTTAWLGVGPGIVQGMAPSPALGPVLDAGVCFGPWRFSGSAGWHRAFSAGLAGVEAGRVNADLLRGGLSLGFQIGTPTVRVGPEAGVGAEWMSASTEGVTTPGQGSTSWPTVRAGMGANITISHPWQLTARAAGLLPLARPSFRVEGEAAATHRPAKLGGELSLAISWAWGSQF